MGDWAPEQYVVTEGRNGPVVGGPYADYETAIRARSFMVRPWRMIWRRQRYWGRPATEAERDSLACGIKDTHHSFWKQP